MGDWSQGPRRHQVPQMLKSPRVAPVSTGPAFWDSATRGCETHRHGRPTVFQRAWKIHLFRILTECLLWVRCTALGAHERTDRPSAFSHRATSCLVFGFLIRCSQCFHTSHKKVISKIQTLSSREWGHLGNSPYWPATEREEMKNKSFLPQNKYPRTEDAHAGRWSLQTITAASLTVLLK